MKLKTTSDDEIQRELGRRLRRARLQRNLTQAQLAEATGLSRRTVTNAESGRGATLGTLIALLRGLGALEQLDALLPDPGPSPIALARLAGRRRQRATGRRGGSPSRPSPWSWPDE